MERPFRSQCLWPFRLMRCLRRSSTWQPETPSWVLPQRSDTPSGAVRGYCHKADGQLEIHSRAVLQVPGDVPQEYELTAVVRHGQGKHGLGIALPVGGRRVTLVIDGYGGNRSGLNYIAGKGLYKV